MVLAMRWHGGHAASYQEDSNNGGPPDGTAPVILAPPNSLALSLVKRQVLGAIVAEEETEWHFRMMIPRSSAVTVQYN